jgi:hypothetical protein
MEGRDRFLVVSPGRSGSSLLCSILAGAGANFDMSPMISWDKRSGAFEHPGIRRAHQWWRRALKLRASLIPERLGYTFCRRKTRVALATVLGEARFVKSTQLVWLVHPIYQLGYIPRIIVSYRSLESQAASRFLKSGAQATEMVENHINTYATAAVELQVFGGCVVDYDDLVDENECAWAEALGGVTGLQYEAILTSRREIVKPRARAMMSTVLDMSVLDARLPLLDATFSGLKGKVILASLK